MVRVDTVLNLMDEVSHRYMSGKFIQVCTGVATPPSACLQVGGHLEAAVDKERRRFFQHKEAEGAGLYPPLGCL